MRAARLASLLLLSASACATGHFRTERMGQSAVIVAPPTASPGQAVGPGVVLPAGGFDLAYTIDLPRAEQVAFAIDCPGVHQTGTVGETFEAYRTRRLAQLNRDLAQQRATAASLTSAVVGAAASRLPVAQAQATGPLGPPGGPATATTTVQAGVDPGAAGAAAGGAVAGQIEELRELPPGDLGGRRVGGVAHVLTTAPGACTLIALTDDPGVAGGFEVTRLHDLDAEARQAQQLAERQAIALRGTVTASLVSHGADLDGRARRAAADAARAEAVTRAQAAAAAHARVEVTVAGRVIGDTPTVPRRAPDDAARLRAAIALELTAEAGARAAYDRQRWLAIRGALRGQLIGLGADPGRRIRLALELEAGRERAARADARARYEALVRARAAGDAAEVDLRARADARARLDAEADARAEVQIRLDAEAHARAEAAALKIRGELRGALVQLGARERPAMPAAPLELAGAAPFDGARWLAGRWSWNHVTWVWTPGGWTDGSRFGATGDSGAIARAPATDDQALALDTTAMAPIAATVTIEAPTVTVEVPTALGVAIDGVRAAAALTGGVRVTAPVRRAPPARDHRHR